MAAKSRRRRQGEISRIGSLLLSSLSKEQARMLLMADLCARWGEAVGEKMSGRSSPESLIDGTLMVVASTPSCAQEIAMRGGDIASLVKEKWSLDVNSVKVRVGKAQKKNIRSETGKKRPPVTPDPKEIAACREKLKEIVPRDDVAEGLARLMAQYRKRFGNR